MTLSVERSLDDTTNDLTAVVTSEADLISAFEEAEQTDLNNQKDTIHALRLGMTGNKDSENRRAGLAMETAVTQLKPDHVRESESDSHEFDLAHKADAAPKGILNKKALKMENEHKRNRKQMPKMDSWAEDKDEAAKEREKQRLAKLRQRDSHGCHEKPVHNQGQQSERIPLYLSTSLDEKIYSLPFLEVEVLDDSEFEGSPPSLYEKLRRRADLKPLKPKPICYTKVGEPEFVVDYDFENEDETYELLRREKALILAQTMGITGGMTAFAKSSKRKRDQETEFNRPELPKKIRPTSPPAETLDLIASIGCRVEINILGEPKQSKEEGVNRLDVKFEEKKCGQKETSAFPEATSFLQETLNEIKGVCTDRAVLPQQVPNVHSGQTQPEEACHSQPNEQRRPVRQKPRVRRPQQNNVIPSGPVCQAPSNFHFTASTHRAEQNAWEALNTIRPPTETPFSKQWLTWSADCEKFFSRETHRLPALPDSICRKRGCMRSDRFKACQHDIYELFRGGPCGVGADLNLAMLKRERIRWHPDRHVGRGDVQIGAREMFTLIQGLIDGIEKRKI